MKILKIKTIIPILIILIVLIYPIVANKIAYTDFTKYTTNEQEKKLIELNKQMDFERFIDYVGKENKFDRDVLTDYIEKYDIKLSEEDIDYIMNLVSSDMGNLGGEQIGMKESVSYKLERKYFMGLLRMPVQTNYANLRTSNKIFEMGVYFLIGLEIFLLLFIKEGE